MAGKKEGQMMKRPKIHDKESFQKGFNAGQRQEQNPQPEDVEILSWHLGYIEGKAEAEKNVTSPTKKGFM